MVINLRTEAPDWRVAKCRVTDPDAPISDYERPFDDMEAQMKICNGEDGQPVCPIRHECLIFSLTNNLSWGVWGGVSESGRKDIRKDYPLKGRTPRNEWEWRPSQVDETLDLWED